MTENSREITPTLRRKLKEEYGTKCRICGAEGAEYHHIIPLSWGGTNDINNFLALCHEHHMMMHGVRAKKSLWKDSSGMTGRPRKLPENYKDILELYVNCKIGRKECQELLGMGKASKLSDAAWFKEYLEEREIKEFKNLVDTLAKKGTLREGRNCGWIRYKGKRLEGRFWQSVVE